MSDSRGGVDALARLRALLLDEGGLMATLVAEDAGGAGSGQGGGAGEAGLGANGRAGGVEANGASRVAGPSSIAAAGPRASAHREEYELLVEAIYEGYLLHYAAPRVLRVGDADLALLAGDRLYAIGLARLVELGDTHAVAELADTITLSALAHGAGDAELAEAVWVAGARAVGWGPSALHERAKDLVLAGSPEAIEAMRTSAVGTAAHS
jgi:hypothetical protein